MKDWQESMLEDLVSYLSPNEDISGLLLCGSLSQPGAHPDEWSDIDILVVVKNEALEKFFPIVDWLAGFGKLYTYSQSTDGLTCTTRACFENFHRIDFVITTEANLDHVDQWSSVPFASAVRVLFSRSTLIDEIARRDYPTKEFMPATQAQFLELVRNFRFKSMLAVYKVVRQDLLIALHLAQDLVRDCCVLAMMLRDRATGTNIHKHGGMWNQYITQWEVTQGPFNSLGILNSIQSSNEIFERLALEWSPEYQEGHQRLFDWMEKAKIHEQVRNPK
jgi:predicted nucleotidyltransferase